MQAIFLRKKKKKGGVLLGTKRKEKKFKKKLKGRRDFSSYSCRNGDGSAFRRELRRQEGRGGSSDVG